jgi:hypothetical protein
MMRYFAVFAAMVSMAAFATDNKPPTGPTQVQAQGQKQGQEQGQQQSLNANQDNAQSIDVGGDETTALGQGSVFIPECGAGGNAGGSNNGKAGFLGFAYVPAWCQDFMYAKFLMAAGDYEAACRVMAESKPGKRAAEKGIAAPKCSKPEPERKAEVASVPTVVVIEGESCASKERAERIFEKCVAK